MNVDEVVSAGIALTDREGLASLSIRKLATELGSGAMSVYRHVESRDQLVQLMVDSALGAPPATIREAADWRQRTARWVEAIVGRYLQHPWLTEAPVDAGITTRNRAEWLETLLFALAESGLPMPKLLDAALLIDGHGRATATLARMVAAGPPAAAPSLDPLEFPYLTQAFALGSLSDGPEGDFGLQRILDGIEVFAQATA